MKLPCGVKDWFGCTAENAPKCRAAGVTPRFCRFEFAIGLRSGKLKLRDRFTPEQIVELKKLAAKQTRSERMRNLTGVTEFDVLASKSRGETKDMFFQRRAAEDTEARRHVAQAENEESCARLRAIQEGRYAAGMRSDRHKYSADDAARKERDSDDDA